MHMATSRTKTIAGHKLNVFCAVGPSSMMNLLLWARWAFTPAGGGKASLSHRRLGGATVGDVTMLPFLLASVCPVADSVRRIPLKGGDTEPEAVRTLDHYAM